MGSVNRAALRLGIREDLASWPIVASLDLSMDASQQWLKLPDDIFKDFLEQKCLIEVDAEVMKCVDIPEQGQTIRVIRGFMGSTKAPHTATTAVNILPSWGWTDFELNRILPQAIRWLKPYAWIDRLSANFTWAQGQLQATAPSGVSYPDGDHLYRLEVQDTDSNFKPFFGWHLYGSTIRFNMKASSDHTLRARMLHFQSPLTDDTTGLDNDEFEEAITKYAAHLCYNSLKTNRTRYAEYAASLNDRASTPDELIRVAFDLKNQAIVSREEHAYLKPATFGSTYREYI